MIRKSQKLRLNHQLRLPAEAYECRDNPEDFYYCYDLYNDMKWKRIIINYYFKYPGWLKWLKENYPERLI